MPSVRFSRDKRGYEYVYLMHTPSRRGKPGKAQVLYWYRTPPGVRVGRKPFSEDVQRMLEAQHPGVTFDWPTIINTPMPPPDMTEFWRDKRRAAKAAREERRQQEAAEEAEAQPTDSGAEEGGDSQPASGVTGTPAVQADAVADEAGDGEDAASAEPGGARKRRRRRGGRRRRSTGGPGTADGEPGQESADGGLESSSGDAVGTVSEGSTDNAAAQPSAAPQTEPES